MGSMDSRLGVVGIVIRDRQAAAARVNSILSEHGEIIVGRMGIPYNDREVSVIALIVDGSTDGIGALTGKLGVLPGVVTRSALTPK